MTKFRFPKIVVFCLLVVTNGIFACKPLNQPTPNSVIFLTFMGNDTWEIWKTPTDGASSEIIYQIPRKIDLSSSMQGIIVSQVRDQLKSELFSMKGNEILETGIWSVGLSPNQKFLSWNETAYWCPGNYCYGQSAIRILNLENNSITTSYATTDFLGEPSWSPDSKFIVFDQASSSKGDPNWHQSLIYLFDVKTSSAVQLAQGYEPAFAKNDGRIFAQALTNSDPKSCCQIVFPSSGRIENLSWITDDFAKIAVSPNGNQLLIVTYENNVGHPSIVNLRSHRIDELAVSFDEIIREISWSPDGKLFAVRFVNPFKLIIFNTSGDMQLSMDNVWSWKWAENRDDIIFTKQGESACNTIEPYIYITKVSSGETSQLDLPTSVRDRLINKYKEDCQNNLVTEITW